MQINCFSLQARRGGTIRSCSLAALVATAFIPDACPYPYAFFSSMGEGVTADLEGNVYTAECARRIQKFARR